MCVRFGHKRGAAEPPLNSANVIGGRYHSGRMTESITGITPVLAMMSVAMTFASFNMTPEPSAEMRTPDL